MVLIEPQDPECPNLTTEQIIRVIEDNASSTAMILLSAIQYYTGQYFDMKKITEYAHAKGILIGWDCAHAVGNVDLQLHDWGVDFAAWCSYKYLNSGPGGIAGLFVHERHGRVDMEKANAEEGAFRPRLAGWWGGDKGTRFLMNNGTKISFMSGCSPNFCSLLAPARRSGIPTLQPVGPGHERSHCFARALQSNVDGRYSKEITTTNRLSRTAASVMAFRLAFQRGTVHDYHTNGSEGSRCATQRATPARAPGQRPRESRGERGHHRREKTRCDSRGAGASVQHVCGGVGILPNLL